MRWPCLIRLLAATIGLAVGICILSGKPPADGYHTGLRRMNVAADVSR